ncbi:type II toxin-antitoxin system RelE/ParE family toxin [Rhodobacteraceae bacterium M385]|nr:type II toxin-antitoxin system RelE/ParE family toxin [Rhodobacteraceae bacterium M385]
MKRLEIARDAEGDLREIWLYSQERYGTQQANHYLHSIRTRMDGLLSGVTVSRPAFELRPGLRRALAGQHVVFFREDAETVAVVRVLHQRMDVGRV